MWRKLTETTLGMVNRKAIADETLAQVTGRPTPRLYDDLVEIPYRGLCLPAYLVADKWKVVINGYSYVAFPHRPGDAHEAVQQRIMEWADSKSELFVR